jgi:hypothetical protein
MRKVLSYLQNKKVYSGARFEDATEITPAISKSFIFCLRFIAALAKAQRAGNPDSAIHPQFM